MDGRTVFSASFNDELEKISNVTKVRKLVKAGMSPRKAVKKAYPKWGPGEILAFLSKYGMS